VGVIEARALAPAQEATMDSSHTDPRAMHASPRLRRIVVAVLAVAGASLATARVLARPAPAAPPGSMRAVKTLSVSGSFADRVASSGEDNGPGCDESALAKHP